MSALKCEIRSATEQGRFKSKSVVQQDGSVKTVDPKYAVLAALGLVPITPLLFMLNLPHPGKNKNSKKISPKEICKDSTLQCMHCDLYLPSHLALKTHCLEEHDSCLKYYCKICSKLFSARYLLQKHKQAVHNGQKPYTCTMCPMNFVCLEALTAHVRRHNGKLPYTCGICERGFDLYQELKDHKLVHRLGPPPKQPKIVKIHTCKICDRQFRKPCDLERHVRVHTGEKPYACSICGNRFQQGHNLTKHMMIHTKEKQYECDLCKKVFGRSDVLNRHMLTHAVQKPHQCDFCPQSFARSAQLLDHVSKKHADGEITAVAKKTPKKSLKLMKKRSNKKKSVP